MVHVSDLRIRDPFVVPIPEERTYYLYGTNCGNIEGLGFAAYRSSDLEHWEGPFVVFRPPHDFWAQRDFWAPEVHRYRDRFYMFATFKANDGPRGTQVLVADSPLGPFEPLGDGPLTPPEWECLDGTLYVDGDGQPWMVFCHEWLQVHDGRMVAMPLSDDLSKPAGDPQVLFTASEAPWAHKEENQRDFVTDGPFLYRPEPDRLVMLWSSFGVSGYAVGVADSTTGQITGPWKQRAKPLYAQNGGHPMLFRDFEGDLRMSLHAPNDSPEERPQFLRVGEGELLHVGTIRTYS